MHEHNEFSDEQYFKKEIIPSEFLIELIQNQDFQLALTEGAKYTARTGYEACFDVYLNLDREIIIPCVFEGRADKTMRDITSVVKKIKGREHPYGVVARVIDLHFHPGADTQPSKTDIRSLFGDEFKLEENPSIAMIASVDNRKNIHIVCIKKPPYPLIEEDVELYQDTKMIKNYDPKETIDQLARVGLEAFTIDLKNKKGESQTLVLSDDSIQSIRSISNLTLVFEEYGDAIDEDFIF